MTSRRAWALPAALAVLVAAAIGLGARHLTTERAAAPTVPPVARATPLRLSRVSLPAGLDALALPAYPRHQATSKTGTTSTGSTSGSASGTPDQTDSSSAGSGAQAASTPAGSTPKTSSSTTTQTKTKTTAKQPSSDSVGGGDTLGG